MKQIVFLLIEIVVYLNVIYVFKCYLFSRSKTRLCATIQYILSSLKCVYLNINMVTIISVSTFPLEFMSLKGQRLACISCLNCNCKTHFLIKNTNMGLVQIWTFKRYSQLVHTGCKSWAINIKKEHFVWWMSLQWGKNMDEYKEICFR